MVRWLYCLFSILFWTIKADVPANQCYFEMNSSRGEISSGSVKDSTNCSWGITAPIYHKIKLTFTIFQLEEFEWSKALLKVYDGKRSNNTILGVFSGTRRPFNVQSSGRYLLVKLTRTNRFRFCNFKATYTSSLTEDKPRIRTQVLVLRTVPDHCLSFVAEGTPTINISLLKNASILVSGIGMIVTNVSEEGNYTCVASNKAGTDKLELAITFTGCGRSCLSGCSILEGRVENWYKCEGTELSGDLKKCIPTTTTKLTLQGAKLRDLPAETFRYMDALNFLYLKNNEIEDLRMLESVLANLYTLEGLGLSFNKIQHLPPGVFANLSQLVGLGLSSNKIQHLPPGVFANLSQLLRLGLSSNKIQHLPPGVFANLSQLVVLQPSKPTFSDSS